MWTNPKYKALKFKGGYDRLKNNDRVFFLMNIDTKKVVSFESAQQAKKQGWIKGK